jgi:mediator of RNA polymerase II transcription subunit 4
MRRGHLSSEEPLGLLGETHSVGRRMYLLTRLKLSIPHAYNCHAIAPSPSPEPHRGHAANLYRPMDNNPPQPFDLDLDLNPDL